MISRVARGNFTPRPSRNRTGDSRLIRLLSPDHWSRFPVGFLPIAGLTPRRSWVIGPLRSMPITGTSMLLRAHPPLCPASVLWPLWGFHLGSSLGIEATGSLFEPGSDSRHLHAGRHAGSQRISPALIPGQRLDPGFDVVLMLSTRHRWFPCGRLSDPHLTRSRRAFSLTLTTGALDPSRSRWFGACLRRPAPRGRPSSRTHIAWRTIVSIALEAKTPAGQFAVEFVEHEV